MPCQVYACVLYVYVGILQIFHLWHFASLYTRLQSVVTYVCIQMCKWKLQWSMANQRNITCKQTLWILKYCRVWMFYKRPLWECCRWNSYVGACVCVCVRACTLYVHMLFLILSEAPADLWALWHYWCYITTWPDHMELLHIAWYYVTIIQLVLCYGAHTERDTPYTHTVTILHMYCLLWNTYDVIQRIQLSLYMSSVA